MLYCKKKVYSCLLLDTLIGNLKSLESHRPLDWKVNKIVKLFKSGSPLPNSETSYPQAPRPTDKASDRKCNENK